MRTGTNESWPILRRYDRDHLSRIALPLGGIGTGTVSLGGRGDLRDWELMNRPAKGYVPGDWRGGGRPFFVIRAHPSGRKAVTRLLEGPLEYHEYDGERGSTVANHGLPRFQDCSFAAAYPLGQVELFDPDVPVKVRLDAFNPLIPGDADLSGIPVAILRYHVTNLSTVRSAVSICGVLPNFIGHDGACGSPRGNGNRYRSGDGFHGIFLSSAGVERRASQWGTMSLATEAGGETSYRTAWLSPRRWGTPLLDFWDDFSSDGRLDERSAAGGDSPVASLVLGKTLAPGESRSFTFLVAWHFPNRYTWTGESTDAGGSGSEGEGANNVGNYYATRYADAWCVVEKTFPALRELEDRTVDFVRSFCRCDLPDVVKEAALFNLSTLRSQTCFRTADGRLYGWEGCNDTEGCCPGSCTHVWNYEQTVAFLFGGLAMGMREVEFAYATGDDGMMSFRVSLPLDRAQTQGKAAADGQMGCIMKLYRDWRLSGDDKRMRSLLPAAKRALEFCWIPGGCDGDQDGVMEGCQHNTMDVEYYGPNPQMELWYLGALRAAEEMTRYVGDDAFAERCRELFERGRSWTDGNLFNGSYYEHHVMPPAHESDVAAELRLAYGAEDVTKPDFQLGPGCLVDQLVGQFMAHVCGLGYLVDPDHVGATLRSIIRYNRRVGFHDHFNTFRSYALGDESALLMAAYPGDRPKRPFPYFTEAMTGFEYVAAIGMLYEGQIDEGLRCIADIRARYDGRKRNPFDETECGRHYARAMAAWAAHLALTGFHYSAVDRSMRFASRPGEFFWSNGYAWGTITIGEGKKSVSAELGVKRGTLSLVTFALTDVGETKFDTPLALGAGEKATITVARE